MKKEQETITVKEAAKSLHVSQMTVYRMLNAGKLNAVKRLVNRHRQSFIRIDKKWKKEYFKKNKSEAKFFAEMEKSFEPSDKEFAIKAEAACNGAAANAEYARIQAESAENHANSAESCYNAARAVMEDTAKYRGQAHVCASKAKEEAQSAACCVIWCVCGAVLSLLFAIAHFIL